MVKKKIEGQRGRLPVTAKVLKLMKKRLIQANWPLEEKRRFWAVACILWGGSFRVHEILSKRSGEYDHQITLLWDDIEMKTVKLVGKTT